MLLTNLPEGKIEAIHVGQNWTAAVALSAGARRCGLASTLKTGPGNTPPAGLHELPGQPAQQIAAWACSPDPMRASVGVAVLNALIPAPNPLIPGLSAEELLVQLGKERRVALVGHFHFAERLRSAVDHLDVLELHPQPGDLPADAARRVIPLADIVAITSMALINHTLAGLLELPRPDAAVLMLGPSTPLDMRLFGCGVDILAGSVVTAVDPVIEAVLAGASFREIRQVGVALVTLVRSTLSL